MRANSLEPRANRSPAPSSKSSDMPSSKGITASAPARSISSPTTRGTIVFVEVKTKTEWRFWRSRRGSDAAETATDHVDGRVLRDVLLSAEHPCRFDVVAVDFSMHAAAGSPFTRTLSARMVSHRPDAQTWSRLSSEPIRSPAARSRSISDRSRGRDDFELEPVAPRGSRRRSVRSARAAKPMPVRRSWRGARAGPRTCPAGRCASCPIAIRC